MIPEQVETFERISVQGKPDEIVCYISSASLNGREVGVIAPSMEELSSDLRMLFPDTKFDPAYFQKCKLVCLEPERCDF